MSHYDAILIPGGGVRSGGELPIWIERRLDRAMERRAGAFLIALSAGTPHRPPPLDQRGFPILEAAAEADYLIRNGVPPECILKETASYDTIGNAYFSLVIHILPRQFRRLLVITSEFHMPRTEIIFRWIYGLAGSFDLNFEATSNEGIAPVILASRRDKENAALSTLSDLMNRIHTLVDLHYWLFNEHKAYRAARVADQTTDANLLQTY